MARPIVRDFLTGAVSLAGLAGLVVTLMMFGEFAGTGQKRYTITAHVANAGGLSDSSPVTLNGVRIGTIDRVSVRRDGTAGATLTLKVLEDAAIPRHAVAMIDKGIFGDAGLEFTVPPTPTPAPTSPTASSSTTDFIKPGETVDLGAPVSPLERITKLVEEPLTRLANSMGNVEDLTRTYQRVGDNLNDLLEPRTPEQIAQGKSPNLRSTLDRADRAITSAQLWLDDDQLRTDARETIARAKNLADELTRLSQAWTSTAKSADESLGTIATNAQELTTRASTALEQLTAKADATLTSANSAATQIEQVAGRMNRGEGTLGQLSTNPDLYRSLTDAVQRLDRALVDLDALLVQFRTEGIPVDF
jgi:phospholipid/cholesterol/gamma-HCH transport system substrate-binding protein